MSFKYQAQKINDNHYILPCIGGMRTDVHAFFSEALYEASEEAVWEQVVNGASYDGVIQAYLMPDAHSGFGVPIGSVIVTDSTLIQAGSGFDISCGLLAMKVPGITVENIVDKSIRRKWIDEVEKRVATGLGIKKSLLTKSFSTSQIKDVLRFGSKALGGAKDLFERQYIEIPDDVDVSKLEAAFEKGCGQLGSLGSGNHFIELQVDTEGNVWVMFHTGSRGYGYKTAEHFFYAGAEARGLPKNRREESWVYLNEDIGREYWAHHNSAANFAIANRYVIALGVQEALQEVFGVSGEIYYDISHNLVQEEYIQDINGGFKKGFVHRKGATRAFPIGHPGLNGSKWMLSGHPIIIPGSMSDGAAIAFPSNGAYKSGYSVNHGSGRILARGEARRQFEGLQDILNSEMDDIKRSFSGVTVEGILSNQQNIPADESKHVYKNLDVVLDVLQQEDIAHVKYRMYPVANIKGKD